MFKRSFDKLRMTHQRAKLHPLDSAALVVSIHDVSPRTRDATERMLDDLQGVGVERCSLLLIPDHHHRGRFCEDDRFCEWVRMLVQQGHEAVLHGYYHERPMRSGESIPSRVITRIYTAGEGEFFDLEESRAAELLSRGRADFTQAGLEPVGFIAPAWLLGDDAARAVKAAGFLYTTRLDGLERFPDGQRWRSQSLVWSVRSGWRRAMSLAWNALLARRLRPNPLMRVSLHPPDIAFPAIWKQALALISGALEERQPMTYQEWVAAAGNPPQ